MISKTMKDHTYFKVADPQTVSETVDCPTCTGSGKIEDVFLPKSDLEEYKINRDYYEPLDALDIKKTSQTWIALVRCDSKYGKKMRFYKWRKMKDSVEWKVDSARMDITGWNMTNIQKFLSKYTEDNIG